MTSQATTGKRILGTINCYIPPQQSLSAIRLISSKHKFDHMFPWFLFSTLFLLWTFLVISSRAVPSCHIYLWRWPLF